MRWKRDPVCDKHVTEDSTAVEVYCLGKIGLNSTKVICLVGSVAACFLWERQPECSINRLRLLWDVQTGTKNVQHTLKRSLCSHRPNIHIIYIKQLAQHGERKKFSQDRNRTEQLAHNTAVHACRTDGQLAQNRDRAVSTQQRQNS